MGQQSPEDIIKQVFEHRGNISGVSELARMVLVALTMAGYVIVAADSFDGQVGNGDDWSNDDES